MCLTSAQSPNFQAFLRPDLLETLTYTFSSVLVTYTLYLHASLQLCTLLKVQSVAGFMNYLPTRLATLPLLSWS